MTHMDQVSRPYRLPRPGPWSVAIARPACVMITASGPSRWRAEAGSAARAQRPEVRPVGPASQQPASQHARPDLSYPADLAAATLLAAGLLTALGRRRREQLWQRAFGRRVAAPQAAAALAEAAIRLAAGEESAGLLDAGLRQLGSALASQDRALPQVYAARLTGEYLEVSIATADQDPPWPWTAVNAGREWQLPLSAAAGFEPAGLGPAGLETAGLEPGGLAAAGLDPGTWTAGAPFPGLVSIGTDDLGRVLIDLEAAQGLIAVNGPPPLVRAALAAMAMELATNRWSDQMQITLVGFGTELALIAPDRVLAVSSLAEVLPSLEARAAEADAAATAAGTEWVLTGRMRGPHQGPWVPHYLIMAEPPAAPELDRLRALASAGCRTAAGYLIAGDVPGATWTWTISEDLRLRAGLLGFDVRAQLLPPEQYAAVVELFRSATDPGGPPARPAAAGRGSGCAAGAWSQDAGRGRPAGSGVRGGTRRHRG